MTVLKLLKFRNGFPIEHKNWNYSTSSPNQFLEIGGMYLYGAKHYAV